MANRLNTQTVGRRRPGRPSNAEREARAQAQVEAAAQNTALQASGIDPLSNVSDATITEYMNQCEPLYEEMLRHREKFREAQGRYRSLLKKAEQNNVIELDWLMKTKRKDMGEVDRQLAARNRLAVLARLPLGTQLGFLPGQSQVTVASVVDEQQIRQSLPPEPKPEEPEEPTPEPGPTGPAPQEPPPPLPPETAVTGTSTTGEFADVEEAKAYAQGGRAKMFGRTLESNPMPIGSRLADVWAKGWSDKDVG